MSLNNENVPRETTQKEKKGPQTAKNGVIDNPSKLVLSLKIYDRIVHLKARRRLNRYLIEQGEKSIGERNLNFLSVISVCYLIWGVSDGNVLEAVKWGGYSKFWKNDSRWALRDCKELGYIFERRISTVTVKTGLTPKGKEILYLYERFFNVVLDEIQTKFEILQARKAAKKRRKPYNYTKYANQAPE